MSREILIEDLEKTNNSQFRGMEQSFQVNQTEDRQFGYTIVKKERNIMFTQNHRVLAIVNYFKKEPSICYIQSYYSQMSLPWASLPRPKQQKQIGVIKQITRRDNVLEFAFKDNKNLWKMKFISQNLAVYWQNLIQRFIVRYIKRGEWFSLSQCQNSQNMKLLQSERRAQQRAKPLEQLTSIQSSYLSHHNEAEQKIQHINQVKEQSLRRCSTESVRQDIKQGQFLKIEETMANKTEDRVERMASQNEIIRQRKAFHLSEISQYRKRISLLQSSQNIFQLQIQELKSVIYSLKEELNSAHITACILQTYNQQLKKQYQDVSLQLLIKQQKQQEDVGYQQQIQTITQQLASVRGQKDKIQKQYDAYRLEINDTVFNLQSQAFYHIFEGNLLQLQIQHKQFLTKAIERYLQKTILRTSVIYYSDQFNKTNIHQYIDKIENFAIIIKTARGKYVAGYSESALDPQDMANGKGLLLSLTNEWIFPLSSGRRCLSYNDYYLIFGNNQLKIKSHDKILLSNFGQSDGYFETVGYRKQQFFGQQSSEILISGYEIHRIFFRQ